MPPELCLALPNVPSRICNTYTCAQNLRKGSDDINNGRYFVPQLFEQATATLRSKLWGHHLAGRPELHDTGEACSSYRRRAALC